jgi:hypothetical protein
VNTLLASAFIAAGIGSEKNTGSTRSTISDQAVDLIEKRIQQNRPLKVVKVRRGIEEDPDAARIRHFAAHPEDRARIS